MGSILLKLADLVAAHDFKSPAVKIRLLKALRDIEYRSSIAVNEEWLLDHLIATFATVLGK